MYYMSLSSCNLPADKYQRDVGLIGGFGGTFLVSVVVILSVVIGWRLWKRRKRGGYQDLSVVIGWRLWKRRTRGGYQNLRVNGELWQLQ